MPEGLGSSENRKYNKNIEIGWGHTLMPSLPLQNIILAVAVKYCLILFFLLLWTQMERLKFSGLPSLSTFTKKERKTQIFPIIITQIVLLGMSLEAVISMIMFLYEQCNSRKLIQGQWKGIVNQDERRNKTRYTKFNKIYSNFKYTVKGKFGNVKG